MDNQETYTPQQVNSMIYTCVSIRESYARINSSTQISDEEKYRLLKDLRTRYEKEMPPNVRVSSLRDLFDI